MILISRSCNSASIPSLLLIFIIVVSISTGTAIACQAPEATEAYSDSSTVLITESETETEESTTEETTTEVTTEKEVTTKPQKKLYTRQDAIDIAKVLYKECGGVKSKTEQACVAWTILNSVDKNNTSIYKDVRVRGRYAFYESTPVRDDLLDLAYDVLERWEREKNGETDVGRVLPKGYIYFVGDGKHNYFRNKFRGDYQVWDYSLESPYEN